jgi:hypothetical protein
MTKLSFLNDFYASEIALELQVCFQKLAAVVSGLLAVLFGRPSSNAPASEVIAPPSKSATTA